MRIFSFLVTSLVLTVPQRSGYLKRPFGATNPLVSPDGNYSLIGKYPESQLWIVNNRTHQQRLVLGVTVQTMTLAWAPDSTAFLVNDRPVSNFEISYLYDVQTLQPLNLRRRIAAADPSAIPFLDGQITLDNPARQVDLPSGKNADHQFVHATRWLDAKHVEVDLIGHTDSVMIHNHFSPSDCFVLRYRISRTGAVTKLSRHVYPVPNHRCRD